ncbi:MAG: Chemotaxis protein methyltransferase [Candidatus Magnetoglobus multicellularis str. Araruama]|uniref:protein-glutamate O-methyltransferase n=1 Tax=Candidatus Magnetoglobus multicellularis str. Araruama TaxID=890399 RepID=A0A1V1PBH7_9BACT|nr:MAG: Chemotaxis protein methyltransferase [Candidatus Magnetoglobus multicellularis str. Araruama]
MSELVNKIYKERGLDFRAYNKPSLSRRLSRVILSQGITSYHEYISLLDSNPSMYELLLDGMTINVTEFFRDKTAFNTLGQLIKKLHHKKNREPLNIWSAGCATGQEPYTIAMIVLNELNEDNKNNVSIIASDIDPKVLEFAQKGIYDSESIKNLEPAWVNRFL